MITMAKNKKRPKYVEEYINEVNNALEKWGVKDDDDSLFFFACNCLLKRNMYEGFNTYKHVDINGETRLVLAETCNKDKFDCLQIH